MFQDTQVANATKVLSLNSADKKLKLLSHGEAF